MNRGYFLKTLWAILFIGASAQTNAALISRLGGLAYYDTVLDITWLADANAGAGSIYDDGASSTDGRMTWASANAWAASLNIAGITGWRLPNMDANGDDAIVFCFGGGVTGCSDNEFGYLRWEDNITAIASSPFNNVQANAYWSSTELHLIASDAWLFNFFDGGQIALSKNTEIFAWAVHSGDVDTTVQIPEPGTIALIGLGLVGLLGFGRRLQKF